MVEYRGINIDLNKHLLNFYGHTLDMFDLMELSFAYKRMCVAEYIQENLDKDITEQELWKLSCDIYEVMDEFPGISEDDAIDILHDAKVKGV